MKKIIALAVLLFLPLHASILSLRSVKQPLYLHGGDEDPEIRITDVPIVFHYADPEWRFPAISQPFIPAADGSWKTPHDVNLASLYLIKVEGGYKKNSRDFIVTIDASSAEVPNGYPFTIAQVIDSVETCVKLMYPARPEDEGKLEIEIISPEKAPAKNLSQPRPSAPPSGK
ncbi:MAG: hypothetical protein ACSHX9_15905 [Luteolibacter sp.]